jgi:hypothetical protein
MVTARLVASPSIISLLTSILALSGSILFWANIAQNHSHIKVKIPSTNFFIIMNNGNKS